MKPLLQKETVYKLFYFYYFGIMSSHTFTCNVFYPTDLVRVKDTK